MSMRGCRWRRVEGHGMVRVREDEALLHLNGQFSGIWRVNWCGINGIIEYTLAVNYDLSLSEPQEEVFV